MSKLQVKINVFCLTRWQCQTKDLTPNLSPVLIIAICNLIIHVQATRNNYQHDRC